MGIKDFRKLTPSHNRGFPLLGFFTYSSGDKRFVTCHHLDQAMLQRLTLLENCLSKRVYMLACRDVMVLQGNIIDPPCSWMSRCWNATVIGGSHTAGDFWIVWISTSAKHGTIVQRFDASKMYL
jgi:hypothetical protein